MSPLSPCISRGADHLMSYAVAGACSPVKGSLQSMSGAAVKKKEDILKRYLSKSTAEANGIGKAKKKRKRQPASVVAGGIMDLDEDGVGMRGGAGWDNDDAEERPLVVDERGNSVRLDVVAPKLAAPGGRGGGAAPPRRDRSPDASPPRRKRHDSPDASPPRRKRHDSPDASPPRRKRHDSPDASPPRRKRHDSPDASPPRRKRHDSPDASPPRRKRLDSPDASPPRRKRHDSPDASPPRRKRHDSPDASPPRRKRHDSPDASPPRRKRQDSPDPSPPRRKRHDSPDASPPRRRRHDSPEGEANKKKAAEGEKPRMLKTGEEFRQEMEAKAADKAKLYSNMDAQLSGQNADTIVRDRKGKKLEMLTEFMTQEAVRAGKEVQMAKEQYEWGKGKVQKQSEEERARELEEIKNAPFARYADDPTLERERKMKILADDPMAAYMMKKVQAARAHLKPEKPEYKGPPPKPNRFNIRPGYRWDGIDRGNQWEARWFKKQGEMISKKEEYQSWSMADL